MRLGPRELFPSRSKWWEEPELPKNTQWRTMEHNGVIFPPAYKPHGVKMIYNGEPVSLTPAQEEIATFYASESC